MASLSNSIKLNRKDRYIYRSTNNGDMVDKTKRGVSELLKVNGIGDKMKTTFSLNLITIIVFF